MNRRPLAVTIIACVYIVTGAVGAISHATGYNTSQPFPYDIAAIVFVSLLAIVAGAFMLRGHNWARWLALAWMAFHVVVSVFNSMVQVAMHALFLAVIAWFLFRPGASRYFRGPRTMAGEG